MNTPGSTPESVLLFFDNLELELETPIRALFYKENALFVAKDVCRNLEIVNYSQAVEDLDEDERITLTPESLIGYNTDLRMPNRGLIFVTESGLYALIFKSRKPQAKVFRKWVTSEVLPSIRRKQSYHLPDIWDDPSMKWLAKRNTLIAEGMPADLATFAGLLDTGLKPTVAAKYSLPEPRAAIGALASRPHEKEPDEAFMATLEPGLEYSFADLVALSDEKGFYRNIINQRTYKKGILSHSANSKFGLRLQRITMRNTRFVTTGKGISRRYVLLKAD